MSEPVALPGMDPIDRLAVLEAGLAGAVVRRRRVAAPFDAVWRVIADLQNTVPRYETAVDRVRIVEERGEFLRLMVRDVAGREDAVDARLRPGWCLMQSATVVVAFAARPLDGETLLAHLEHRRPQDAAPPGPPSAPADRAAAVAKIDEELRTIEELATGGGR
ncbi:hypothetical protein amrb99_65770 [Actinomadura sp. RB99]|uniref:hypothetical protein n=1 Tax=Actinomadura sp. RB99 TaxID=2691577 RepID=UPI001681E2B7|nr:hypothetical protein [Actinomadura sp. RB99]MBD2897613.1 hypothetical protein [Actinomadura sp. RB99]